MPRSVAAQEAFAAGFSCSQAVLTAFSRDLGLPEDVSNRIACAFGGGCARRSLTCGAVSGAFMVIGLKHGKTDAADHRAREKTYSEVNEFCRRFEEIHGSLNCGALLGCDLATEAGQAVFKEKDFFRLKCNKYVKDACDILEGMGYR